MMVSRWVSSKSSRLAEIALTNAAPIASSRSGRPMIADVAAPLNGSNVFKATVTARSWDEPSAVAKKFRIEGFASCSSVAAPCASSCRTERIPRVLFFHFYSGALRLVDRNLMLDRLTDNLDIWSNAGKPGPPQQAPDLTARQGANHGSRNNRLCRNGPHGRADGRTPARCRLFALHLRCAARSDQGAGRAGRTACEVTGRGGVERGYRAGEPADPRHRQGGSA